MHSFYDVILGLHSNACRSSLDKLLPKSEMGFDERSTAVSLTVVFFPSFFF